MSFKEFLFGDETAAKRVPTMTEEQQQLLSQILAGLGGPLGMGLTGLADILSGRPEAFEAFQAPAMRQFREQIVPGIAERFTGLGAQRSSAFQQALGQAGASLAERLAAQRAGLQMGARGQLAQLLGVGLQQRPFGYLVEPGREGFLAGAAPGIGAALGGAVGGPFGASIGSAIGGGLSRAF